MNAAAAARLAASEGFFCPLVLLLDLCRAGRTPRPMSYWLSPADCQICRACTRAVRANLIPERAFEARNRRGRSDLQCPFGGTTEVTAVLPDKPACVVVLSVRSGQREVGRGPRCSKFSTGSKSSACPST